MCVCIWVYVQAYISLCLSHTCGSDNSEGGGCNDGDEDSGGGDDDGDGVYDDGGDDVSG